MKISKLFHWLYAILMLLPVFFVGGRVAYTIFNKNAYENYSGNDIKEETIIDDYLQFLPGETYNFTTGHSDNLRDYGGSGNDIYFTEFNAPNITTDISNAVKFSTYINSNGTPTITLRNSSNSTILSLSAQQMLDCTFVYQGLSEVMTNNIILGSRYIYKLTTQSTLDNAFTYSINEINENLLFSWAQTSFVVSPMTYITNLFGMPANSPVLTLLSYWLSISIIWLVFDLVMYVPLLVHRWIDKGIVE